MVVERNELVQRVDGYSLEPRQRSGVGQHGSTLQPRSISSSTALVTDPDDTTNPRCPASGVPTRSRARRLPWADLLCRVFAEDIPHCLCGGHRSVTAFVVDERLARS